MKRQFSTSTISLLLALTTRVAAAQDVVLTPPTEPISVNVYALVNTTVAASTNNLQTTANPQDPSAPFTSRGTEVVAGGQGLCCGSRLGISGAAAFGSGLGGVFQLESGFLFNQGTLDQQQQIFGRQAYAGLTFHHGSLFNVVAVGRQYDVAFVSTSAFDPYGHGAQIFTAWDTALYGARFDNSIQDILTISNAKVLFQYSPGSVAGNGGNGTTLAGGALYQLKPFILGGTISHSNDAAGRGLDVYGGGTRYTRGSLVAYAYGYDTRRDGNFAPAQDNSGEPLANTSILPNTGNPLRREDRYGNLTLRYNFESQYSLIGMYKFDKAVDVNALHGHGTESTYMLEGARGVTKDFFLYTFVAFTKLTGAEVTDANSPNGLFAGASSRTYGGVGLNYQFNLQLK